MHMRQFITQYNCRCSCSRERGDLQFLTKYTLKAGFYYVGITRIWHQIHLNCCYQKFGFFAYHFLAPSYISNLFSQWPSWEPHTFLQLSCFGLDFTSFCNCILCSLHIAILNICCYLFFSFCRHQGDILHIHIYGILNYA